MCIRDRSKVLENSFKLFQTMVIVENKIILLPGSLKISDLIHTEEPMQVVFTSIFLKEWKYGDVKKIKT